jgi:hypothetical protein
VSWLGARAVAQTAPPSAAGSDAGAVATCLERALAAFAAKDQTALSDLLCGVLAHGAGPGSDVIAEWSPRWPPPGPDLKAAKITVCGDMAYAVLEAPPPLGRAAPEDALDRCSLVVVLVRSGDAWRIAGMSSILSTTDPATLPPGTRELWVRGHELLRYDIHNMVRKLADVGWDVIADSHFVAVPDSRHGGLEVVTAQALMARLQAEMDSRHSLRADIPSMTLPDKREEFSIVGLSSAFFTARVLMHGADGSTSPVQWAMLLDWPTDHPIWEGRLVVVAPLPDKRAQGPTQ